MNAIMFYLQVKRREALWLYESDILQTLFKLFTTLHALKQTCNPRALWVPHLSISQSISHFSFRTILFFGIVLSLQVPQHYKLMGYQPVSAWDAFSSCIPATLARQLRTGAPVTMQCRFIYIINIRANYSSMI